MSSAAALLRPMTPADADAVHALSARTFEELARRMGEDAGAPPDPRTAAVRHRHLAATDPEGAWVAEAGGAIVGAAEAIVRERLWGLSLLVVDPAHQSDGLGRRLLAEAHATAAGARGRIVLSSPDPRAMRAYARLGLDLHPCLRAEGVPRPVPADPGVRPGTAADLAFTADVDRHVRGAAHGEDLAAFLEAGAELLVAPERGYAVVRGSELKLLAAYDEAGAAGLLGAVLARAGEQAASVEWLTSAQQWAIRVVIDAGLALRPAGGAVFLAGDVGPFRPYLPSGAYL